jgi:CMP-N,N'-diacetyllegionaminic acid synthase
MNVMAFIPARGGSKGIARKNLALAAGKPLLEYTIEAARASKNISNIFISTEDDEIARFCRSRGIDVPYIRPMDLASDESLLTAVLSDALDWLRLNKRPVPDAVMLLQPTSPLRNAEDIDKALAAFYAAGSNTLISVHEMTEHPYECIKTRKNGWDFLVKHAAAFGRQQYKDNFYFINGAIYIVDTNFFLKNKTFINEGKDALYMMPAWRGVDVDTPADLELAEFYLKKAGL